ncbi:hypothetical protein, partial [Bifidobacterium sp. UBA6881]
MEQDIPSPNPQRQTCSSDRQSEMMVPNMQDTPGFCKLQLHVRHHEFHPSGITAWFAPWMD